MRSKAEWALDPDTQGNSVMEMHRWLPWRAGASAGWIPSADTGTAVQKTKSCSAENFLPSDPSSLGKQMIYIL